AETSQVADGDAAVGVDLVLADPVVSGGGGQPGGGFDAGVEGDQRGAAGQGAVGSLLVVVAAEVVELELEVGQGLSRWLPAQVALECLVQALDLAACLGVVGGGVLDLDAQALQLQLEGDFATARATAEDGGVVTEKGSGQTVVIGCGGEGLDRVQSLDHRIRERVGRAPVLALDPLQNIKRTTERQKQHTNKWN